MTDLNRYFTYGLHIASSLPLPELLADVDGGTSPDVTIIEESVPEDGLANGEQISPFLWVDEGAFWFCVPDVARFLVRDGARISIDRLSGADDASVRVFLLGSGLGALLFQREMLILHGNAIEVDGKCLVCVGHSGAGKSTLAAAFRERGYRILADDVVPVDGTCSAVPGFPRIKLWQDAAKRLGIATDGLNRIRPEVEKFNLPVRDTFSDKPLPIRWVYALRSHNMPELEIDPVRGMDRFRILRANTYRLRFMEGMKLKPIHLQRCGELAGRIHVARIIRPNKGFDLDGLADLIIRDIAENP